MKLVVIYDIPDDMDIVEVLPRKMESDLTEVGNTYSEYGVCFEDWFTTSEETLEEMLDI